MVIKKKYLIPLILFFSAGAVLLQEKPQIDLKKNELEEIRDEINTLEQELTLKSAKEKETYSAYENYNKQNFLINKLINKIKEEEKSLQNKIEISRTKISSLEKEIDQLQRNYSKYVVAIYKYGKQNELASLFDSKSVQQALLRYKYLQRFSEKRQEDLKNFEANKSELEKAKAALEVEKREREVIVTQKQKEESSLNKKISERKKILGVIRNDKASLKKELEAKRIAESKIKNLITKLIEDEERRKKEEAEKLAKIENEKSNSNSLENISKENTSTTKPAYDFDLSNSNFASFSNLKGKLNWPILNGNIIRKFGENLNSKLNTVTLNYGVDIKASNDLSVKAVADGIVSAIDWIPGYGSVIIITHKENYRTVYSHLSEIYVKEGDKLKGGNLIAKVGESLEGDILHFEIWNSRINQNPEVWLVSK
ncbi:MAG: peptidoglycan DD-metalloendopeptidase family protein [Ignavibacteriaceae bacterium]